MTAHAIDAEKLVVSGFVNGTYDDPRAMTKLFVAQQVVEQSLKSDTVFNAIPFDVLAESERLVNVHLIALTGGIFVFDESDRGAIEYQQYMQTGELPPLPFQRTWLEMWSTEERMPVGLGGYTDWVGDDMVLLSYGIYEQTVGSEWYVYALAQCLGPRSSLDSFSWRLLAKGHDEYPVDAPDNFKICCKLHPEIGEGIKQMSEDDQGVLDSLFYLPIAMAQVVNVLGVRHDEQFLWRPVRRRYQRKFGQEHPKIYFVNLGHSGEPERNRAGGGIREYQHRWIVRGHYRLDDNGRYIVPGKGQCTWVRAHVKGPEGAPWKGRPIHTTVAATS